MGFTEAKEFFKQGQLREALKEINLETKSSNNSKLLMGLNLYYYGQFKNALNLANQILTEKASTIELLDEFKARIIKGLSLAVFLQWGEGFIEINNAENLVDQW